tara:strand:- start:49 stop:219 length:171 start_codon:yes stop_codon:yes gene_type:complete
LDLLIPFLNIGITKLEVKLKRLTTKINSKKVNPLLGFLELDLIKNLLKKISNFKTT